MIKKFENWKESDSLSQSNRKTGILSETDALSMLLALKRYDIDTSDNGEFIEQEERQETDGKYVKSEDIDKIINILKN